MYRISRTVPELLLWEIIRAEAKKTESCLAFDAVDKSLKCPVDCNGLG